MIDVQTAGTPGDAIDAAYGDALAESGGDRKIAAMTVIILVVAGALAITAGIVGYFWLKARSNKNKAEKERWMALVGVDNLPDAVRAVAAMGLAQEIKSYGHVLSPPERLAILQQFGIRPQSQAQADVGAMALSAPLHLVAAVGQVPQAGPDMTLQTASLMARSLAQAQLTSPAQ